jgi:hypothetical protein
MTRMFLTTLVAAIAITAVGEATPAGAAGVVGRPSVSTGGTQGNGDSLFPAISSNGRFVAYGSSATNLVSGDTNSENDVFVRDRQNGTTERVSVSIHGTQGNGGSQRPATSGSGRYVAFESFASNLVDGDSNGSSDVFVRDRKNGTTKLVSVASGGVQSNSYSQGALISAHGRYVTFESGATNLVSGDTNGTGDVFLRDLDTGRTTLVSIHPDGKQFAETSRPTAISADGRYVAFNLNQATGISLAFIRDRRTGTTTRLSIGIDGAKANDDVFAGGISANGRFVALTSTATNLVPGDTNGEQDVFVRDLATGDTRRVSIGPQGVQADGGSGVASLSADGRYVALDSGAANLVARDTNGDLDVFVHDRQLVVRGRRKIPSVQEPVAAAVRLPEPRHGYGLSASHH